MSAVREGHGISEPSWSSSIRGRQVCPAKSYRDLPFWGRRDSTYFTVKAGLPTSPAPFPQSAELCRAASLTFKLSHLLKCNKAGPEASLQQAKLPYRVLCPSVPPADSQEQDKEESPDTRHMHWRSSHASTSAGPDIADTLRPEISQLRLALKHLFTIRTSRCTPWPTVRWEAAKPFSLPGG